jgi:hypothetical protein
MRTICIFIIAVFCCHTPALFAETAPASPKKPWGEFQVVKEEEPTWITHALLWVPNRIVDFIDIFRVDAGVGVGTGAVVRLTSWGQMGIRDQEPGMLRIGDFGRDWPVIIEDTDERGFITDFTSVPERNLCKGIIGVGADVVLVGAHAGFCPEELLDFVLGIFFIDIMDDDYQ